MIRKYTIMILFLTIAINATAGKRQKIEALETALKSCLSTKEVLTDTIIVYSGKEAVRVAKQVEKTKRKNAIQNTKVVKSENKTEVKTDDTRLWTRMINKTFTKVVLSIGLFLIGRKSKDLIGKGWFI